MPIIGERIHQLRRTKHLTQEALAADVEVDQSRISDYERSKENPTAPTLEKLAKALDTSVDYLLGLTDDPTPPLSNSPGTFARKELRVIELWREGKNSEAAMLILSDGTGK